MADDSIEPFNLVVLSHDIRLDAVPHRAETVNNVANGFPTGASTIK